MRHPLFACTALFFLAATSACSLDGDKAGGSGLTGDNPGDNMPNGGPPRGPEDAPFTGSGLYRYQGLTDARIDLRQYSEPDFMDVALDAGGKTSFEMNGLARQPATQLKAGVQFTPPRTGAYKVTASFSFADSGNSTGLSSALYRLSDGTSASPAVAIVPSPNGQTPGTSHTLVWAFTLTEKVQTTVRLQERVQTGTRTYLAGDPSGMAWLIEEL